MALLVLPGNLLQEVVLGVEIPFLFLVLVGVLDLGLLPNRDGFELIFAQVLVDLQILSFDLGFLVGLRAGGLLFHDVELPFDLPAYECGHHQESSHPDCLLVLG